MSGARMPACYSVTAEVEIRQTGDVSAPWIIIPKITIPPIEAGPRIRKIAFLLDVSSSMDTNNKGLTRLDHVKTAMPALLDQLKPHDRFSIITFNHRAEVIVPFQEAKQQACIQAKDRITKMTASGKTSFSEAFQCAKEQIANQHDVTIIFLTDGEDDGASVQSLRSFVPNTRIIPIGIFGAKSKQPTTQENFLENLFIESGGQKENLQHIYENQQPDYTKAFQNALAHAVTSAYRGKRLPRVKMTIAVKGIQNEEPLEATHKIPLKLQCTQNNTYQAMIPFNSSHPPTDISWKVYIEGQCLEIRSEKDSATFFQRNNQYQQNTRFTLKPIQFPESIVQDEGNEEEQKDEDQLLFPSSPHSLAASIEIFGKNTTRTADALAQLMIPHLPEKQFAMGTLFGVGGAAIGFHLTVQGGVSASLVLGVCGSASGALLLPAFWYGCRWLLKQRRENAEYQAFLLGSVCAAAGAAGGVCLGGLSGVSAPLVLGFCATGGACAFPLLAYACWRLGIFVAKQSAETLYKAGAMVGAVGGSGAMGYGAGVMAGVSSHLLLGCCTAGAAIGIPVLFYVLWTVGSRLRKKLPLPPSKKNWHGLNVTAMVGAGAGYAGGIAAGVNASLWLGVCAAGGAVVLPLLGYCCLAACVEISLSKRALLTHSLFSAGGAALGYYGGTYAASTAAASAMAATGINASLLIGVCATGGAIVLPFLAYGIYRCCAPDSSTADRSLGRQRGA